MDQATNSHVVVPDGLPVVGHVPGYEAGRVVLAVPCAGGGLSGVAHTWDGYAAVPTVGSLAAELVRPGAGTGMVADVGVEWRDVRIGREGVGGRAIGWEADPWDEMERLVD